MSLFTNSDKYRNYNGFARFFRRILFTFSFYSTNRCYIFACAFVMHHLVQPTMEIKTNRIVSSILLDGTRAAVNIPIVRSKIIENN